MHPHLSEKGVAILTQVAEWLEAGAPEVKIETMPVVGFNMSYGVAKPEKNLASCGTVCCIAGAAVQFNEPFELEEGKVAVTWCRVFDRARKLLLHPSDGYPENVQPVEGLSALRALFEPGCMDEVTTEDAAWTLRRYLATGKVFWRHQYDVQQVEEN